MRFIIDEETQVELSKKVDDLKQNLKMSERDGDYIRAGIESTALKIYNDILIRSTIVKQIKL